jgi:hypothetical protein
MLSSVLWVGGGDGEADAGGDDNEYGEYRCSFNLNDRNVFQLIFLNFFQYFLLMKYSVPACKSRRNAGW